MTAAATPLRLMALDTDDLAVISANLQDTLVRIEDLAYFPNERRFVLAGRRFDWVKAAAGGCERCEAGLHFTCVRSVARSGFDQTDAARVLNLLAIDFEPGDAPSGTIILVFSGGAAVRLSVECIEAQMSDLGPRWPCDKQPKHALDADT
jgi:hypothetical protein